MSSDVDSPLATKKTFIRQIRLAPWVQTWIRDISKKKIEKSMKKKMDSHTVLTRNLFVCSADTDKKFYYYFLVQYRTAFFKPQKIRSSTNEFISFFAALNCRDCGQSESREKEYMIQMRKNKMPWAFSSLRWKEIGKKKQKNSHKSISWLWDPSKDTKDSFFFFLFINKFYFCVCGSIRIFTCSRKNPISLHSCEVSF